MPVTDQASTPVVLPSPPVLPTPEGSTTVLTSALPMVAGLGSMVMLAGMSGVGQGRALVAGGFFLLSTSLVIATQLLRQRRQHQRRVDDTRVAFLRLLAGARSEVAGQRQALLHSSRHEWPTLADVLGSRKPPRCHPRPRARLGTAAAPPVTEVVTTEPADPDRADPVAVRAVDALRTAALAPCDLPFVVDLDDWDEIVVHGRAEQARDRVRALVCQSALASSTAALEVALSVTPDRSVHWEWLKWLPHHRSSTDHDVTAGLRRLVDRSPRPTEGRHLVMVVDGTEVAVPRDSRTTVVRLVEETAPERTPTPRRGVLRIGDEADLFVTSSTATTLRAERCTLAVAGVVARRLDRLADPATPAAQHRLDDLPAMLGIDDLTCWEPSRTWGRGTPKDDLRVPIGLDASGRVVHLDLKESARGGHGPHGLVVGATGSGKSELLRTLVLALALRHSPDELGMVLVDFKGGATFAGLAALPQVSAVVTNLGDDLGLVDRMADTLTGELVRRQELLRAGGHSSLADHRAARAHGADLPPLPSLLVCVDEFSELLAARPDFVDVFVAIGRVGRSLGVHLLLASQRLEEGRLRGLETHLSYRVGLRTFSAAESRAAIGTTEAHALPPVPGVGLLATGSGDPRRFTAAYVSGPHPTELPGPVMHSRPLPWTLRPVPTPPSLRHLAARSDAGTTTLDLVVARTPATPRTHRVWLPPLEHPPTLTELLGELAHSPTLGLHAPGLRGGRAVPVGLVDRPREQRREVWQLDLSGAGGHCAVVGGPRSGKTTALRTIVTTVALSSTPYEVQFLLLDLAGGALAPLGDLPHVVASASRGDDDMVGRVVEEVVRLVDRREAYFLAHGIYSFDAYVRRRDAGTADDGLGEVFVVVDGWSVLRADDVELELSLQRVAERALALGVHLVVSAQRWGDVRPGLRDLMGSRLELRLGDPIDSLVDRRRAAGVPNRPGHGLVGDGLAFLGALPQLATQPDPAAAFREIGQRTDPFTALVAAVARGWPGPGPARMARLPQKVDLQELHDLPDAGGGTGLVLASDGHGAVTLGPLGAASPRHLLVDGGPGSGRTSALRTYLHELQRLDAPSTMQVVLVDPRGTLEGSVGPEHLLHHLVSRAQMRSALGDLAAYLHQRLPGVEVTAKELRARSWWTGAEVTVVVDDHDLVTAGGWQDCGLHLLAPLVPQAREVGLHVVVARRSTPRTRAQDPLLQALTDLEVSELDLGATGRSRTAAPPGRGVLTTRSDPPRTVQVAWTAPAVPTRVSAGPAVPGQMTNDHRAIAPSDSWAPI